VVRGAAGVGKTALLDAFADAAAARGHLVARGRCAAREHLRLNAWDALVDELATYLAACHPTSARRRCPTTRRRSRACSRRSRGSPR
jgi:hypothetical protein